MRKLIVCCDGTWNTLEQRESGIPIPTNVARLYFSLDLNDPNQLTYYHPGVGTFSKFIEWLTGGMLGYGIDKNIMSGYRWICDQYQEGDEIYLFGFSRGAYTARSLGGFLGKVGILNLIHMTETNKWSLIKKVYKKKYREKSTTPGTWLLKVEPKDIRIRFIGVWDTVGALGIPDEWGGWLKTAKPFHDTDLGLSVQTARHAVALDEVRASFTPTLWTNYGNRDVKQIWFPGVHSDVGGGYIQTGLSDSALAWMIDEAAAAGLVFDPSRIKQIRPNYQDVLHDSYVGLLSKFKSQPRTTPHIANIAALHPSAISRNTSPTITELNYRQSKTLAVGDRIAFSISSTKQWNTTGLYMNAGEQYTMQASGEWVDKNSKFGPEGTADCKFRFVLIIYFIADIAGHIESILTNSTFNLNFSRRNLTLPWFSLVGVIADGGNPKCNGTPPKHNTFLIGNGCTLLPLERPGYFYAYANDVWKLYGNNHGSVELIIQRTA